MTRKRELIFTFSDPRQRQIHDDLHRQVGPAPAGLYVDACRLLDERDPYSATSHLVAHCCREIESALRAILRPSIASPPPPAAPDAAIPSDGDSPAPQPEDQRAGGTQRTEVRAILRLLDLPTDHPAAIAWTRLVGDLHGRAHRATLDALRPVDDEFAVFWERMQTMLQGVLPRIETRFAGSLRVLDELLAKRQPGKGDAKRLLAEVPNNAVTLRYFFDANANAHWLAPLRDAGLFDRPPAAERGDDGGLRFPPWPASAYLARMAVDCDDATAAIILGIMLSVPDTDNAWVHADLADAACALPPDRAALWAAREAGWLGRQESLPFGLPDRLGPLVAHLARGGEAAAALELARAIFAVLPDILVIDDREDDDLLGRVPLEARGKMGTQEYAHALATCLPTLIEVAGDGTFALLCDLLDRAVFHTLSPGARRGPQDISFSWRPAIEDNAQNHGDNIPTLLVTAVRDVAEGLAAADPARVPALVAAVERRRWQVFRRIALHLLRLFPAAAPRLVAKRLMDRARFADVGLRHEYVLLVKGRFARLSAASRRKLLAWIEDEAERDAADGGDRPDGSPLTAEDRERIRKYRIVQRLAPIRDDLPPRWRRRYEMYVADIGEPSHPEFLQHTEFFVGFRSPKSAEDLRAMAVEEIASFLRTWRPDGTRWEPSPQGLGEQLSAAIAAEPERFALGAGAFVGLDPTYVRGFLVGIERAVREKIPFDWGPVLTLCEWAVQQIATPAANDFDGSYRDPGWRWARKEMADVLGAGLVEGESALPIALRARVWAVLQTLAEDADPSPEDEARATFDPYHLALNTTRGAAMIAAVQYALWVRRFNDLLPDGPRRAARGLAEMPEVRTVLNRHLAIKHEPSRAVRSVYGGCLPQLAFLDESWIARHLEKVFPVSGRRRDLYEAAWDSYLLFCHPHGDLYSLLARQYARAVEDLGHVVVTGHRVPNVVNRLAQHLLSFYWWGLATLDAPDGLLHRFFLDAPPEVRGHAMESVGRGLANIEGPVDPDVIARSVALWEQRRDLAREATEPGDYQSEMAAFGWWFYSGRFDAAWTLAQLEVALRLAGRVVVADMLLERMKALAPGMPRAVLECLSLMLDDAEGGSRIAWDDETPRILAITLESGDADAARTARDIVNRLCAWGFFSYRALIEPQVAANPTD